MQALAWLALLPCAFAPPLGCTGVRVPAIDPSGQRIFAPAQSTTVVGPCHEGSFLGLPQPAFQSPPDPPPCDFVYTDPTDPCDAILGAPVPCPPGVAVPTPGQIVVPGAPGFATGGLVVAPGSLISPVGSEVVLTAGVAGAQNHHHHGQRIEWMLSQDSVGSFVEIGDQRHSHLVSMLFHHNRQPQKMSANYAVGYTTNTARGVARSARPGDMVNVPAGHSWLTLTSATEGASHVTAFAPDVQGSERRQQTATVYWIDAQWAFPPPAMGRAGQQQTLTTAVTRSTNGSPLVGWVVRYEAVGGPAVAFGPAGERVAEVQTNAQGLATVPVIPLSRESGATQIAISVIRPAGADGLPAVTVGQGGATVSWSAPGLAVRMSGPEIAELGSTVSYRVEVSNPGDIAAPGVTVSTILPAALQFVSSSPAAQVLGERINWTLGDIAPRSVQVIEFNARAIGRGDIRQCVQGRTSDGLAAESCQTTRVFQRSLTLNVTGPETAQVGETVQYRLEVTNRGDTVARNVRIRDTFDAGFQHAEAQSPIDRTVGDLAPGQSAAIAVTFQVVAPGQHCHSMEVSAEGEQTIVARSCLTATQAVAQPAPPAPQVNVQHTGPLNPRQVGQTADFAIVVSNVGAAPLTNVRVVQNFAASLLPVGADQGFVQQGTALVWVVPQIGPGQQATFRSQCRCESADLRACSRATVSSDQTSAQSQDACLRIEAAPAAAPRPAEPPPAIPAPGAGAMPAPIPADSGPVAGSLRLEVTDRHDPVQVGGETIYRIDVINDRNVADRNIAVTLTLPPGMARPSIPGTTFGILRASPDGRQIDVTPIRELRPGERTFFEVRVTVTAPGRHVFRAEATSERQGTPVAREADTTAFVP